MPASADPPRIPPLPPSDWPPEMREALAALRPARIPGIRSPPGTPVAPRASTRSGRWPTMPSWPVPSTPSTATSCSPRASRRASASSWSCGWPPSASATYEWRQHVVLATDAGITPRRSSGSPRGRAHPGWSTVDRAMMSAVDELLADARVADETWEVLAADAPRSSSCSMSSSPSGPTTPWPWPSARSASRSTTTSSENDLLFLRDR